MSQNQAVRFVDISTNNAGQRLDNFLLGQLKGAPRSLIYRIIRKGEVRVNKKRCKPDQRLQQGDQVRIPPVRLSSPKDTPINPDRWRKLEQAILHEDSQLMVLNKPSGIAVHGGSEIQTGLIEALRALRPENKFLELAHRLDRQTSGCLVLAKSRPALLSLQDQLRDTNNRNLHKTYLALLKGQVHNEQTVTLPLDIQRSGDKDRRSVIDTAGKPSTSIFAPLENFNEDATLVSIELITGRNHQARAHAAAIGHPIAGDDKYGDREFNRIMKTEYQLKRLFLHAWRLEFIHPKHLRPVRFEAPTPEDLCTVLSELRA